MGQISLSIPQVGQPDSTEEPKIANDLTLIENAINGNLDTNNLAAAAGIVKAQLASDVAEPAFSTYKDLPWDRGGHLTGGTTAATYLLGQYGTQASQPPAVVPVPANGYVFYLDPGDWLAGARQTKLRIRGWALTDATAPAVTFTIGLYPVATWGGASGSAPTIATIGVAVSGSTAAIASPAASSQAPVTSTAFTAPAAGFYVIAVAVSGTSAANATVAVEGRLQMRQV
jgi:hypothetical protein